MSRWDDPKPSRAPAAWIEALERVEEDIAAGRVVDSEVIFRELEADIGAMEAEEAVAESTRGAVPNG